LEKKGRERAWWCKTEKSTHGVLVTKKRGVKIQFKGKTGATEKAGGGVIRACPKKTTKDTITQKTVKKGDRYGP